MKTNYPLCFVFCVLVSLGVAVAQEPAAETAPEETVEATPGRAEFDSVFGEWKDMLSAMRELRAQAQAADDEELPGMVEQYNGLIAKGEQMIPQLRDAAIAVYKESPNTDRQITRWLSTIGSDYLATDRFAEAAATINALIEGKATDPVIYNDAGVMAFANHEFEKAKGYFEKAAAAGVLTGQSDGMNKVVDDYIKFWGRESRLRKEADALEGDDRLPRVKMETNKGTLVFELFEDEAPETVGNFVHLVESGFYDGLTFHRVLGGFMMQGGCPQGNGQGGPGYNIFCECTSPDHRKHFTGSLSMAHAGRDTGGSQFFVTFVPTPMLNGDHTVFGRVIEGLDVLPKINRRDPDKPTDLAISKDKIIKAEVLNKRDHAYKPKKVKK